MKIILQDITGAYNLSSLNSNFQKIQEAINEKILFRENIDGEDNALKVDIDVNQKRLFNLPEPIGDDEPMRKGDMTTILTQIQEYADNVFEQGDVIIQKAQTAAASAQGSATEASESATEAGDAAALAVSVSANVQEVMENAAAAAAVAVRDEVKDDADRAQQAATDAQNAASSISLPIPITSGGTGGNSLAQAKTNLGINNVDNTRDLDKPVSNAVLSLISSLNISPAPNLLYNGSFLYNITGTASYPEYFGQNSRSYTMETTGSLSTEQEVISGWSYKDNQSSRGPTIFSTGVFDGYSGYWGAQIKWSGNDNDNIPSFYRIFGVGLPHGIRQTSPQTFTLTGRFRRTGGGAERRLFISLYDPSSDVTSLQVVNMNVDSQWVDFKVVFSFTTGIVGSYQAPSGLCLRFCMGAGTNFQGVLGENSGNRLYSGGTVQWEGTNNNAFALADLKLEEGNTNTVPVRASYSASASACASRYQAKFFAHHRPFQVNSGQEMMTNLDFQMQKPPTITYQLVSGPSTIVPTTYSSERYGALVKLTASAITALGDNIWGVVLDARHPLL